MTLVSGAPQAGAVTLLEMYCCQMLGHDAAVVVGMKEGLPALVLEGIVVVMIWS